MVSMAHYERRKKKRKTDQQIDHQECKPFTISDQVEVSMKGSVDESHRSVRYDHLALNQEASVSSMRPPRLVVDVLQLHYGLCVDVYVNNAWCEGVIFDHEDGCEQRLVFFPETCDEHKMSLEQLRITQDWDEGSGCWSCRGKWLFLAVIEEKKKGMSVDLSEKDIWFSVKAKEGFDNWNCCNQSLLDGLVSEVVSEMYHAMELKNVEEPVNEVVKVGFDLNAQPDLTDSQVTRMESGKSVEIELENEVRDTPGIILKDVENTPVSDNRFRFADGVGDGDGDDLFGCIMTQEEQSCYDINPNLSRDSDQPTCLNTVRSDSIAFAEDNEARQLPEKVRRLEESPKAMDAREVIDDDLNKNEHTYTNVKHSTKRKLANWLPAVGTDILPAAEYCPESMEIYLQTDRRSRKSKSNATFTKIRMHLSSVGWKVEFKQSEVETKPASAFRYIAPDGKTFYNLLDACKHNSEFIRKINWFLSYSPSYKQRLVTPADKLGCSNLEDSLSQPREQGLGTPPDKVDHRIPKDSSPGIYKNQRAQHDGNVCHGKPPPFDISEGKVRSVAVNSSPSAQTKDLKLPETESLAVDHVSDDEAVGVNSSKCAETKSLNLPSTKSPVSNVEKVGVDSSKCRETRNLNLHVTQSSPVSDVTYSLAVYDVSDAEAVGVNSPKCAETKSLNLPATESLVSDVETAGAVGVDLPSVGANVAVSDNYIQCGQSKDLNPLMESPSVNHVPNAAGIEPEYNPQAVIDWNEIGLANKNGSSRSMSLKARKHLMFVGWNLWHTVKMKNRLELRYTSPMGKTFITLVSACKACIEQGMLYGKPKVICSRDDDKRVHDLQSVQMESNQVRPQKRARQILEPSAVHYTPKPVPTLNKFEAHAGNASHQPAAHIFEDGRPLLKRGKQIIELFKSKCSLEKSRKRIKRNQPREMNDHICSECHYGGGLVLCDQCPSSFHLHCLGLNDLPKGQWFCPSCRCGICDRSDFNGDSEQFTENTVLYCDQCEREYHVGCIRQKGLVEIESLPQGTWFCSQTCEQIFVDLHRLLGKPIAVGENKLTWTLLKYSKDDYLDVFNGETTIEHHHKLTVALGVLHECFEPIKELYSKKDLIEDVLFNKWSELNRLNFRGFYTVLLERENELISVATIRIYGEKVAEIPLVGTRFQYRCRGMCHLLMDVLEKKLTELGVEMLVLPAVPQILDAWTSKFGFSKMTSSDRLKFLQYTFLDFQDTTMCQKILSKTTKILERTDEIKSNGENFYLNSEENKIELIKQSGVIEFMQAPVRGRRRGPPRRPSTSGNLKLFGDSIKFNSKNIDLVPEDIIVENIKENEVKSKGEKNLTKAPKTLKPTGNLDQLGDEIKSNGENVDLNSKEAELDKRSGVTEQLQAPVRGRRRGRPRRPDTSENLKQFGDEIKCNDENIDLVPEEIKVEDMKRSELLEQMPVPVKSRRCGPPRRPRLHFFEPTPRLARRASRASVARRHLR